MAAVDTTTANTAFAKVARVGLGNVELADVRAAALMVWYGQEDPTFDAVRGPHLDEAVALVERLSYYNVVPLARKKALKRLVQKLRTVVRPGPPASSTTETNPRPSSVFSNDSTPLDMPSNPSLRLRRASQ